MRAFISYLYNALRITALRAENLVLSRVFLIILKLNKTEFGSNIQVIKGIPSLLVSCKSAMCKIGDNVTFRSYQDVCWNSRCYIQVKKDATFIIGDNSGVSGTMIYCQNRIEIGKNVMIGGGCRIFDTDFHPLEVEKRLDSRFVNDGVSAPIYIEDNVFIGTNSIIGKGVRIGKGSVVAAGSIVVKSIPSNEIWGGNPAKFIRKI